MGEKTTPKDCHCYTCAREFHSLGIARHRAMHRDRGEDCEILYSDGAIYKHNFAARAGSSPKDTDRKTDG